jgi:hypothetical protein
MIYLFYIIYILSLPVWAYLFWFLWDLWNKSIDKTQNKIAERAASVLKITFQVKCADGRIENRSLEGNDARDWYLRWINRWTSINYKNFKWKFEEIK